MIFTHISVKPNAEGLYICRCIDKNGNISYRIDEYRTPTVFEEKYEGIEPGFQLDHGSGLLTEAYLKLNDDYESNIIKFNKDRNCTIFIDNNPLTIELFALKEIETDDETPRIYFYPIKITYNDQSFNSCIKIYEFDDISKITVGSELKDIINKTSNNTFKEYMNKYFERYMLLNWFGPEKEILKNPIK